MKNRPSQPTQTTRRAGRRTSATVRHGEHRASAARLTPGREIIDHSGRPQRGRASYYGREFNGRKMANGRPFNPNADIAASRSLPLGTVARVKNRQSGRETTVRVEDRGPYVLGRILDVAPRAADNLDMRQQGVAPVVVEPVAVPSPMAASNGAPARHRRAGATSSANRGMIMQSVAAV